MPKRVRVEEADAATLTIKDPDRDTSDRTVRVFIGQEPLDASDERGDAAGGPKGEDITIQYSVPDPGDDYYGEIIIEDGSGGKEPWARFYMEVRDWQSID
jgi:hypothetical protein